MGRKSEYKYEKIKVDGKEYTICFRFADHPPGMSSKPIPVARRSARPYKDFI